MDYGNSVAHLQKSPDDQQHNECLRELDVSSDKEHARTTAMISSHDVDKSVNDYFLYLCIQYI